MKSLLIVAVMAGIAVADPAPAPTPELRVAVAPGQSLLERVNATGAAPVVAPAVGPLPQLQGPPLPPITVQFQFFPFGPALGAGFRL